MKHMMTFSILAVLLLEGIVLFVQFPFSEALCLVCFMLVLVLSGWHAREEWE
jgi:hypothetical protein